MIGDGGDGPEVDRAAQVCDGRCQSDRALPRTRMPSQGADCRINFNKIQIFAVNNEEKARYYYFCVHKVVIYRR